MSRKLIISLLLLLCVVLPASAEPALDILAVNFPCFDFAREITRDTAHVQMLLPPGSESHSYEPTPQDIIAIQNADLFIYVGGESDTWVEGILHSMGENAPRTFRLSDPVTLLAEETSESMQHDHAHEHGEDCEHEHAEMDEHVWTSPKNAKLIISALRDELISIAPEHAKRYEDTAAGYLAKLDELDQTFEEIVAAAKRDLIIFGDRFPFRYFANAYHLHYDAAFPGCSEDSEPSVRTVISLVDKVRAENIPVIFYIEFSSRRTADILAEETGAKPLLFHSCHNVSAAEIENGASYLLLMRQNAEALKEALN